MEIDQDLPEPSNIDASHEKDRKLSIGADGLPHSPINPHEEGPHDHEDLQKLEEEESPETSEQAPKVSAVATVMNLLNSMIGAGILSVPNSFINCGIFISILILVIMAVLSLIATFMVIILAHKKGATGLSELAFKILGKPGSLSLSILNLLFLITALTSYLILAGDSFFSWFKLGGIDLESSTWIRAISILIYAVVLPIALTIPRNISFLQYFSTATVFCVTFFVVVIIYKSIDFMVKNHGFEATVTYAKFDITAFSSLSIYGLSFALPAVVLPPLRLFDTNIRKRKIVSTFSIAICAFLVCISGVFGYLNFGTSCDGNVLKSFPDNDIVIIIVRVAFFIIVSCAYPMVSQSVMGAWDQLVFKDNSPERLPWGKRALVLFLTHIIALLLAMFLPTAKPILSVGGALGGCLVDFVYPALFWLFTHKDKGFGHWKNILCILLGIFGLVAAVISTYQGVLDAINSFK
ncbi:Transmembrane amino acid transporter protein [Histomonas meleagridis]|uniref:Transmembrane amino acid transporter protein n=1 Tax=Histomonas meleagridis TaxID=135588 RepID=UPI00355A6F35|nr:Transmembrane amino acid transporter protein [Histomonas meleagridis]KAH0803462.1 Transmembrane amino acid transporter protein [Histomonas meleagridis]